MGIDAFVIRYRLEGISFAEQWLASPDFDLETLKDICRRLELPVSGKRAEIIDRIASSAIGPNERSAAVLESFVLRKRGWVMFEMGRVPKFPDCLNPAELLYTEGHEKWYGPIMRPLDTEARWYIRPVFISHWETPDDATSKPQQCVIRWLCLARASKDVLSLHWKGFTFAQSPDDSGGHNSQYPYWVRAPSIFDEITRLTGARLSQPNLHNLILHTLWDQYRYDHSGRWTDRRIRAESGGVSLSAHAGAVAELNVGGIRRLANAIRRSISADFETRRHTTGQPDPDRLEEVVLRTLLREFGTLSYEFSLETGEEKVFRAHTYFGLKPDTSSPDSFPHLNIFTNWRDDLEQLHFLLGHCGAGDDKFGEPEQPSLF